MRLSDILPWEVIRGNHGEITVKGIRIHAHRVTFGDLYISLPPRAGKNHEIAEITEALNRGASVVLKRRSLHYNPQPLALILDVEDIHKVVSFIASRICTLQPETIVGVTGTCGKSSIVSFTRQLWELLGHKAASLGTLGVSSSSAETGEFPPLLLTTPQPFILHACLERLVKGNVTHVALEASSEGLDQSRLGEVKIKAAAFTNLHHDHLDYHGTYDAYFYAKTKLFKEVLPEGGLAILNAEDNRSQTLNDICQRRQQQVIWIGRHTGDLRIEKLEFVTSPLPKMELTLNVFGKRYHSCTNLTGTFQVENILFALGFVVGLGGNINKAMESIKELKRVEGRMELVGQLRNGALIYVDYAHKPLALAEALKALKKQASGKIAVVFGCGGKCDWQKRPMMGEIANLLADKVYITDDNPRWEDPRSIRSQIMEQCPKAKEVSCRKEAIRLAISELEAGDACLIAGKGHETEQTIQGRTLPFDDRKEAAEAILELGGFCHKSS